LRGGVPVAEIQTGQSEEEAAEVRNKTLNHMFSTRVRHAIEAAAATVRRTGC